MCERLVAGERVSKLSEGILVSPATLHLCKGHALTDAGLKAGTKSVEIDELAPRHASTIEEHEAELEAVKAASAQFNGEEPISPEGGARLPWA